MAKSLTKQIQDLVESFQPLIKKAFLDSIADISNRAILSEIIDAITLGDIDRALRSLNLTEAALRPLSEIVEKAFETGGIVTGASFPKRLNTPGGQTVFRFDVRNSRAEAWLRDRSSKKVVEILEQTRTNVKDLLRQGMIDGRNPRNVALDLVGRIDPVTKKRTGGVIGLTNQQASWVSNMERRLKSNDPAELAKVLENKRRDKRFDPIIENAIRTGKPIDATTISKIKARYNDRLLQYRGEVIGRTEAIASLNKGEQEAINQAVDSGAISESAVTRVWDSAGNDGRTRESHLQMDGQTVKLNEAFTFPSGAKAMFPGDNDLGAPGEEIIQCRCVARTVIDWLAGAKAVVTDAERRALLGQQPEAQQGARGRDPVKDRAARKYVINNGKRTGTEHLAAYDPVTGWEMTNYTSGQKSVVLFSPELNAKLADPNSNIYLSHNHPSSSSFSNQDIKMLNSNPGMKGVYAHGHNGNQFYAEPGKSTKTIDQVETVIHSAMSRFVNAGQMSIPDYNSIYQHVKMIAAQKSGVVSTYEYKFSKQTESVFKRNSKIVDMIMKEYEP